jgi:hypothetical protein
MKAAILIGEPEGTVTEPVTLVSNNFRRRSALAGTTAICEIDHCRMMRSSSGHVLAAPF